MIDHSVKTENPKEIKVGETYMIMYVGWKQVKALEIINKGKSIRVQEHTGNGTPFIVKSSRIKINLLK